MKRAVPLALLASGLVLVPVAGAQQHHGGMDRGGGYGGVPRFVAPAPRNFGGFNPYAGYPVRGYSRVPQMVSPAPAQAIAPIYQIPTLTNGGGALPYPAHRAWGGGYNGRSHGHGGFDRGGHRDHFRPPYAGFGIYPGLVNTWDVLPWGPGYTEFGYSDYEDQNSAAEQPQPEQQSNQPTGPNEAYMPPQQEEYRQPNAVLPQPPPPVAAAPVAPEPELTLIFRDGHRQGIHNYVLTHETVIVLDRAASGRQEKIPLADLDVPATEKAARDRKSVV